MEHAGTAVAQRAKSLLSRKSRSSGKVLVLAGSGANGGDGFVAARHLDNWGIAVEVVLLGVLSKLKGAAAENLKILKALKVPVRVVSSRALWNRWCRRKTHPRLIIDALLGTGLSGEVREPFRSAIHWINRQRSPVLSIDLPSGINSDNGASCGAVVRANHTVTCGLLKKGLLRGKGRAAAGRVSVANISLPRGLC